MSCFSCNHSTRRVKRHYDFTRCHRIAPGEYHCVAREVNGAKQLYLAIELVRGMLNTDAIPQFRQQRTAREAWP